MDLYYFEVQAGDPKTATVSHSLPNAIAAREKAVSLAADFAVRAARDGLDGDAIIITVQTDAAGILFTVRLAFNIDTREPS